MGREKLVTREVLFTRAQILFVSVETQQTYIEEVTINGKHDNKDTILKAYLKANKDIATINIPVQVISYTTEKELRAITQEFFLQNSFVVDDKTRRRITESEVQD